MTSAPFPGPGQDDGDQPPLPPGVPPRDGTGYGADDAGADDDWDADADLARFLEDIEAGRAQIPEETRGPEVTFSVGETGDVDPAVLAAMAGPDGLGGQCFATDKAADVMRPGPLLSALAEQAAQDPGALSADELLGLVSAARRLQNRAEYLELTAVAEFTRRRAAELEAAKARKVPRGCRPGEFADQELAIELVSTAQAAEDRMELATALATRLPQTLAGLAAGRIDGDRAATIACYTQCLSDEHAALADQVLAAAAPALRYDQLARKAAALEMKLDPEAVKRRKEAARKAGQRVQARREASGNMSYGGRELGTADVLAAKASIDADAVALRNGGLAGTLRELRVLAFLDRLAGRDPLDRLTATPDDGSACDDSAADPATGTGPQTPDPTDDYDDDYEGDDYDDWGSDEERPAGPGAHPDGPAPLPALINLIVPAATLLGWSGAPAEAGGWGLLDRDDTSQFVQAASMHPRTRWCVTLTRPDGTAIAHGCARGRHSWSPARDRDGPGNPRDGTDPPCPTPEQAAQLTQLLHGLNVTFAPIAKGNCDHRHREDRYTPSRTLKHLVRARNTRCTAPGCGAQAHCADLDHTTAYPDGLTCECGLGPLCRRHHRCKQAPGWRLDQPEPGVFRWTTPSGRGYTTTPTVYEIG